MTERHARLALPYVPLPEDGTGAANGGGAPPAPPAPTAGEGEGGKTLTQADVDRIVADRVARVERKYTGHDDLKAKAARLDELEAASATEMEKAVKAARAEAEQATAGRYLSVLRAAEVRAQAAGLQFRDPGDALAQLGARLGDVKVGDDGEVDGAAVAKLLAELAAAKPYLINAQTPPPAPSLNGAGVGNNGTPPASRAVSLGEAVARRMAPAS